MNKKVMILCAALAVLNVSIAHAGGEGDNKSDITDAQNKNNMLLIQAAKEGNLDELQRLIAAKADVNYVDPSKEPCITTFEEYSWHQGDHTALMWACIDGHKECIKTLLASNADVNKGNRHCAPLICACIDKNEEVVKLLLQHKAEVDQQVHMGYAPLLIACRKQDVEVVTALLEWQADVNLATYDGDTPLMESCRFDGGSKECVKLLLARKPKLDAANREGRTALNFAYSYASNPEIAQLLSLKSSTQKQLTHALNDLAMVLRCTEKPQKEVDSLVHPLLDDGASLCRFHSNIMSGKVKQAIETWYAKRGMSLSDIKDCPEHHAQTMRVRALLYPEKKEEEQKEEPEESLDCTEQEKEKSPESIEQQEKIAEIVNII